jgi:hypothetical protein
MNDLPINNGDRLHLEPRVSAFEEDKATLRQKTFTETAHDS